MGLVVNFSDFENKTGTSLSASDYLVGYTTDFDGSRQELKITVADLITFLETNSGNDLYTILYSNSANWNNTYTSVRNTSSSWNSVYTTTNVNSANWNSTYTSFNNNSSRLTTIDYLSTNNIILSTVNVIDGLSALSIQTNNLSSRQIFLTHFPPNDGTNPSIFIGERDSISGLSGFNIFYDELQNTLTVTSVFSGVSGSVVTIDRNGNASGPMFPYTVTLSKFFSAAGSKSGFWPAALSGVIPASEITSRIREGKGMIRGSFLFGLSCSTGTTNAQNVRLDFSSNPNFTTNTSVFSNALTPGAGGEASILKVFEGYVLDNLFVFPANTANPYTASTNAITNHGPYTNDLYYRVGFNIATGTGSWVNASLSGGSISIIP